MTATYTNQPGTRPIDTVRFEIDDKDCIPETDALLSDEEIQYLIDTHSHVLFAAAAACDAIATKYADSQTSKMVGDLQVNYGSKAAEYTSKAKTLRARAARKAGSSIYAGGISKGDKDTMKADTDRVQPSFTIGGMDHDGTNTDVDRGVIDY